MIAPTGPVDADGVVPIGDMVEKPPVDEAPSDLIIIGRYVLTPDVFEEIAAGRIGALGEIQLTDALRAQAHRSPFHGVVSQIDRFDTGHAAGLPHRGDRARAARPELRRPSCATSSTACPPRPP